MAVMEAGLLHYNVISSTPRLAELMPAKVKANPILEGLGDRRSQRQQTIRSRRLDRIGNAIRGESGLPAFKSAIEQNKVPMYMPAAYHGTPHTFAAE